MKEERRGFWLVVCMVYIVALLFFSAMGAPIEVFEFLLGILFILGLLTIIIRIGIWIFDR